MMSPGRRGSRWDIEDGFLYGLQDRRGRLIPGRRRSSSSSENVEVEKAGSCRCFVGLSCAVAELVLGSFFAEVLDSASSLVFVRFPMSSLFFFAIIRRSFIFTRILITIQ